MNWFLGVFSEPKQQAQLVAIFASALVAVFVLLLNQWFTSRKAIKERKIENVEKLYTSINDYENESTRLVSQVFHKSEHDDCFETILKTRSHFQTIEMYVGLHFPKIDFKAEPHLEFLKSIESEVTRRKIAHNAPMTFTINLSKLPYMENHMKALKKVHENTQLMKDIAITAMKKFN